MDLAVLRTSTRVVERIDGEGLTAIFGFGLMVTDPRRGPTEVLFAILAWSQGNRKIPGDMGSSISLQLKPLEFPGSVTAPGGRPRVRVE